MRPVLPKTSDRYSVDYQEVISAMSDILSRVMTMKDPKPLYNHILKSINELFDMTELALKIGVEGTLRVEYASVFGYDSETTSKMLGHEYPEDWTEREMKDEYKVSMNGYLIDGEEYSKFLKENPGYDPIEMYDNQEELFEPRKYPDQWHEADFFNFGIYDELGNVIGYLEVNDSATYPDYLPSVEIVNAIDTFSQLVGVVNRIWIQLAEEKKKQEITEFLASVLGKDLLPLITESSEYLKRIARTSSEVDLVRSNISKSTYAIRRSLRILDSVTQMIELENRTESLFSINSIDRILEKWKLKKVREPRKIQIHLSFDSKDPLSKVDIRFPQLLSSCLDLLDIVANREISSINFKLFRDDDDRWIRLAFSSEEIEEHAWRSLKAMLGSASMRKGIFYRGYLPLYIVQRIISDYAGKLEMRLIDGHNWIVLSLAQSWPRLKPKS